MIPLRQLRENMQFSTELQEMIEVLKGATSSQFRSLQARYAEADPFSVWLEEFRSSVEPAGASHHFLRERPHLPKVVVMITSDDGFLGNLNALIVNAGVEQVAGQDELIVLGERGARYLSEIQTSAFTVLPGIGDEITYQRAAAVRDLLLEKFLSGKFGTVLVAYARFLSFTVHRVEAARLLPCPAIFGRKKTSRVSGVRPPEPLLEPSRGRVLDYLVRAWLMQKLYDMFWESKLSECAARIIHLEGSDEEIRSVNKQLRHEYFKHLHAVSDKNIREIFASRLRGSKGQEDDEDN